MRYKLLILLVTMGLFGCGGGGSSVDSTDSGTDSSNDTNPSDNNSSNNDYITQQIINDPASIQAQSLNVDNIFSQSKNVNKETYVAFYERIKEIKVFGIPDLDTSFKLNEIAARIAPNSLNAQNKVAERRVDKTYDCLVSGSASEVIDLITRGTLNADTYMAGDDYTISYNNCNMGNTTYQGTKNYHVNEFSEFDFSIVGAGDPMGEFTTRYNQYSMETSTQKITINGSFTYKGEASYPAVSDASPTSLIKEYSATAGSTVTYLNKENNVETVLTYDGILEKITFTKKSLTVNNYTYCNKAEYDLTITENNESTEIPQSSLFCGDVKPGTNELYPPRPSGPVGESYTKASLVKVNDSRIITFILADGSSRYIYQDTIVSNYASGQAPDVIIDSQEAIYNLPETDNNVDLMNGVVVFAYEGCLGYSAVFDYLHDNNISYTYIDTQNTTTKNRAAFDWFNKGLVPWIGINGNYFLNSAGIDAMFKLEGIVE